MRRMVGRCIQALCLLGVLRAAQAETIPIRAFIEGPRMLSAAISPDGHFLSTVNSVEGHRVVVVIDLKTQQSKPVLSGDVKQRVDPEWCGWANSTRLLCGFRGVVTELGVRYVASRLVAVNADGSDTKVLYQRPPHASYYEDVRSAQFQDAVIDWKSPEPNTVLMQIDDDVDTYPTVFAVNVYDGRRKTVTPEHVPIVNFLTDGHGTVRLGTGFKYGDKAVSYFAKLGGDNDWRLLAKTEPYTREDVFRPVAAMPDSDFVYAIKMDGDHIAFWKLDLADKNDPQVIFEHPVFDVDGPLFSPAHRLIGVRYKTDRPAVFYTDKTLSSYVAAVDKLLAGTFNEIVDSTLDESVLIIRSISDVQPPAYYLLSRRDGQFSLARIGSSFPGLDKFKLAPMRVISYPAKDGVTIPGYLTAPPNVRTEKLPLIVLPHDGVVNRDVWGFDELVQFLASRGYAVLQMNFRGSAGYGPNWYWSANQDWGGLTYSDITDGVHWAIEQGIADPNRICIAGWGFGGYSALLAAARESGLYRCAVSIAGVSDLPDLLQNWHYFTSYGFARQRLGTDWAKLKADSPNRYAGSVAVPVLLVHGSHDVEVPVEQTLSMEAALKAAGKRYKSVIIKDADHQLPYDSDRMTLYTELDAFLKENLGPGVQ